MTKKKCIEKKRSCLGNSNVRRVVRKVLKFLMAKSNFSFFLLFFEKIFFFSLKQIHISLGMRGANSDK